MTGPDEPFEAPDAQAEGDAAFLGKVSGTESVHDGQSGAKL